MLDILGVHRHRPVDVAVIFGRHVTVDQPLHLAAVHRRLQGPVPTPSYNYLSASRVSRRNAAKYQ
jgi:hypothetical protein